MLGVQRTTSSDRLRETVKELSLKHHPGNNPDRVQEATNAFQLIAKAYSISRDDSRRLANDLSLHSSGAGARRVPQGSFSVNAAKDLFRDMFGEKLLQQVAKVYEQPQRGQKLHAFLVFHSLEYKRMGK
jgi:DnaJ-class molecular chaperone